MVLFNEIKKVVYMRHKVDYKVYTGAKRNAYLQVSEDLLECVRWDSRVQMEGEATCATIGKVPPVTLSIFQSTLMILPIQKSWVSSSASSSAQPPHCHLLAASHSSLRRSPSFFTNLRNSMTGQYFALHIYFVLFISRPLGFYLSTPDLMCIRVLFVNT